MLRSETSAFSTYLCMSSDLETSPDDNSSLKLLESFRILNPAATEYSRPAWPSNLPLHQNGHFKAP